MLYPSIYISCNLISQKLIDELDEDCVLGQHLADNGLECIIHASQDIKFVQNEHFLTNEIQLILYNNQVWNQLVKENKKTIAKLNAKYPKAFGKGNFGAGTIVTLYIPGVLLYSSI